MGKQRKPRNVVGVPIGEGTIPNSTDTSANASQGTTGTPTSNNTAEHSEGKKRSGKARSRENPPVYCLVGIHSRGLGMDVLATFATNHQLEKARGMILQAAGRNYESIRVFKGKWID